jgi:hypothetical protein
MIDTKTIIMKKALAYNLVFSLLAALLVLTFSPAKRMPRAGVLVLPGSGQKQLIHNRM